MAFDIQGKQAILVQYRRLVAKGVAGMATVTGGNDIMNIDRVTTVQGSVAYEVTSTVLNDTEDAELL
jgi:hypothetical protein